MEAMLNNTMKPVVYVSPDFEGCKAAVEMCEAVSGGADAFRAKPFAACYINVTSGLVANGEALQKCIYLAEKVDQLLESHTVAPLAEDVQKAISDIVDRELEWIGSKTGN